MNTRSAQRQLIACVVELNVSTAKEYGFFRVWYQDSLYHSFADIPSNQWVHDCQWHKHGSQHRAGGRPAYEWHFPDGTINQSYRLRGRAVTQAESAAYKDEDEDA